LVFPETAAGGAAAFGGEGGFKANKAGEMVFG
jgi:hypothetical protein